MNAALVVARAGPAELDACLEIRRAVFVRGQGVSEAEEVDGFDAGCVQLLARLADRPIGTARLRIVGDEAKAERVAVLEAYRVRGAGRALMAALEAEAQAQGFGELVLHAQERVIPFYARLGYAAEGERFFEARIPHRVMRKKL